MSAAPRPQRPADPTVAAPAPPALAERETLRHTTLALLHADESGSAAYDGAEHWPPDGRPSGVAESRERLAHTGERQIWTAQDAAQHAAQTAFAREVAAYTRALRDGGMALRQVLAAVTAVVRETAAPSVSRGSLDTIVHDAGRSCVAAYFAGRA